MSSFRSLIISILVYRPISYQLLFCVRGCFCCLTCRPHGRAVFVFFLFDHYRWQIHEKIAFVTVMDTSMENYRPISLLSSISKVFGRMVFNQLYQYLDVNDLLFDSEYGLENSIPQNWQHLNQLIEYTKAWIMDKFLYPYFWIYSRRLTRLIILSSWANLSTME